MQSKVRRKRNMPLVFGLLFFGVFALAGVGSFVPLFLWPVMNLNAARSWTPVDCRILDSHVGVVHGDDGDTYYVAVSYTFSLDGREYVGDRYDFGIGSSSGRAAKQAIVDRFPAGSATTCYADPEEPENSVVNREPGWFLLWGLFPVPFVSVGLGGLIYTLRRPRTRTAPAPAAPREVKEVTLPEEGVLELNPKQGQLVKIGIVLAASAFWNGIVAIIAVGAAADGPGFFWLFLVPFVLAGLGMVLLWLPYTVLAAMNPRPRLVLSTSRLVPGSQCDLLWEFDGDASRIRELTITLKGSERVRYRRGTKTVTTSEDFHVSELARVSGEDTAMGVVSLSIPSRTMPSFDAPSNEILWKIELHGEIPRWPDVSEDFPIRIYPSESP